MNPWDNCCSNEAHPDGAWPLRIRAIIDEHTPDICRRNDGRLVGPAECLAGLPVPHEVEVGEPCRCVMVAHGLDQFGRPVAEEIRW